MRSTQQFSITLPHELAELVKRKVEGGEYASESEVIREGLRALQRHDRAMEEWLSTEVAATYDAMKSNPKRAVSAKHVRERLAEARRSSRKAG